MTTMFGAVNRMRRTTVRIRKLRIRRARRVNRTKKAQLGQFILVLFPV
jgi:hypothetical protein